MISFKSNVILIPVDFSETSLLAIKHGSFIAAYTKADLFLLHVINIHYGAHDIFLPAIKFDDQSHLEKVAQEKLNELIEEIAHERQVRATGIVRTGSASHEITSVAKEIDASLIVMGTHGYAPIQELVIGSTALKVFVKSPCPTMAMNRKATHKGYNHIVLPIDNTVNSKQKINFAIEFAKKFKAKLLPLGLLDDQESEQKPFMESVIKQIEELANDVQVMCHSEILINVTNRAKATVDYCDKNEGDLIVIMTDQDAELSGFFGPYSQQIIHLSKVPVIAIRPEELYISPDINSLSQSSGA